MRRRRRRRRSGIGGPAAALAAAAVAVAWAGAAGPARGELVPILLDVAADGPGEGAAYSVVIQYFVGFTGERVEAGASLVLADLPAGATVAPRGPEGLPFDVATSPAAGDPAGVDLAFTYAGEAAAWNRPLGRMTLRVPRPLPAAIDYRWAEGYYTGGAEAAVPTSPAVPEPATLGMMALAGLTLAAGGWLRRRAYRRSSASRSSA